jgi:hypothetical protein
MLTRLWYHGSPVDATPNPPGEGWSGAKFTRSRDVAAEHAALGAAEAGGYNRRG